MSANCNIDMEFSVLGQCIESVSTLEVARSALTVEDFSDRRNKYVFSAILSLVEARQSVDVLTILQRLDEKGSLVACGGRPFLESLVASGWGEEAVKTHVQELAGLGLRRRLALKGEAIAASTVDLSRSPDELLSSAQRGLAEIITGASDVWSPDRVMSDILDGFDAAQKGTRFIPSGVAEWDAKLGGLCPGVMTFIGAQPRIGKSALLATMLDATSMAGIKPGYFSLEDRADALGRRLLSKYSGVATMKLARGTTTSYEKLKIEQSIGLAHKSLSGMVVDERSMLTASQVVQRARRMVVSEGAKWIAIDHLGKLKTPTTAYRHDLAIEDALNEFTAFVKEYNVPMVILAHTKETSSEAQFLKPDLLSFAQTSFIARDARVAVGLSLVKEDKESLKVSVLKETEGAGEGEFYLKRIIQSGMVER